MDRPKDDCSISQSFSGYALRSSPMTDIVIPGILIRKEVFFNEYLSLLSGASSTNHPKPGNKPGRKKGHYADVFLHNGLVINQWHELYGVQQTI
jgi:hypothetical protein